MSDVSPALLEPRTWYDLDPNGEGYRLLDPMTDSPANPNTIPAWVEADPLLNAGMGYLAMRGADIRLTACYCRHGTAEHLGDVDAGWFEDQVQAADYYGLERSGTTAEHENLAAQTRDRLLNLKQQNGTALGPYLAIAGKVYGDTFDARVEHARAAYDTPSFVADMHADSHVEVERAAAQLDLKLREEAKASPRNEETGVLYAAVNYVREWVVVARTGLAVMEGELGRPSREPEVLITEGSLHRDLTRKFRLLGTTVQPIFPPGQALTRQQALMLPQLPRMLSTGIVTPRDAVELCLTMSKVEEPKR